MFFPPDLRDWIPEDHIVIQQVDSLHGKLNRLIFKTVLNNSSSTS